MALHPSKLQTKPKCVKDRSERVRLVQSTEYENETHDDRCEPEDRRRYFFPTISLKSVRITQQSRAIRPRQLAMSAFVDASLRAHYRVQVRTVVVLRRPALGEWPPVASSCCQRCIKVVSSRPVRVAGAGPLMPCSAPPRTWRPGPRSSRGRRTLACPPSPCSRRGRARRRRRRREQRRR